MGTRTASVTVITVALPLLLLALTATPAVGKDSEALLWANNFYTKLIEPLKKAADLDGIEKRFKDNNYKLKMPDGTAFTAQLGGFLEDVAAKVIRSTARIAEYVRENRPDPSATDAPESIGNEDNFFVDPCSVYTEAAEGLSGMVDLYASDKFGDEMVNTNHSIVSFTRPTLAKTPKIKNELKNAHGLKNVFMENNKDEFTLFQYFGLSDGLAFTYPAYEVHESSCYPSKKAYDPASRPWFSAAAVGPANIVILFDSSNSMKMFRRLEMAKDAVLALIDSIDDNSYLNVVTFNEEVSAPCFTKQLPRATEQNKQILKDFVNDIELGPGTNFEEAFKMAYNLLLNTTEASSGSGCENIIIFLTDGTSPDPQDFIDEHPLKGKVKVFTYLLGSEIDTDIIKDLSCNNDGIYNRIRDTGDLRRVILRYYEGVGRGHATWVGPYIDVNGRPSVSYVEPVYDNVTDRLIGVAGTDINLDGIKARLERITQDFYGYSFLVDNNGQTVYHSTSDIDTLYDISLYETFGESQEDSVEDEANYKSFMENVRHSLVARVQGVSRISKTIDYLPVCIVNGITDYYYRPIANTLFSVAVAFPRYTMGNVAFETPDDADWVKNTYMSDIFSVSELDEFSVPRGIVITNVSDVDGRSHLTSFTHASVHFGEKAFCSKEVPEDKVEMVRSFYKYLESDDDDSDFEKSNLTDEEYCKNTSHLFVHNIRAVSRIMSNYAAKWKEGYANETVHTFFFGSREGVTISYPGVQVMDGYKVTERSWYRRALSNPGLIMSSPPYSDGFITNKRVVTFSKAVQLDDDEHTIIGVAGIDVAYDDIGSFIDNITSNGCMQDDVECFIIDKYGYLFYNSVSEEQTSLFLGASKGPLVKNLLKNGVITRKTKVTPFGECSSEEGGDESTDASTSDGEETSEACIGVETYYEMTDNIPAEGMSLDIFDTCMQGEYTVVQVAQTNLYMIVFRGHSGYCSDKNAVVPAFDPSEDYWCETYDEKTERYSGTCAHALERECVTTCPGEDDDDATMYCGGHGDCINGACVCDAGFEGEDGGCLVLDAASVHLPLTFAGLAIFLPFILSFI